ncbi:UDP-4-amino-4,6-dideoxy-N-acetyl-beta-L-altrosamine transaminase [Rhodocytophaga aerolata]|uniref:UDP-4-amino-4, 6-dideoxy-N-acetyl-beta-L-altrosamine transaminase n=1 Tax=Rhodocytophaga aerolata TaxID=455078 RepID=A0ABT8QZ60_9BACT|nr:UDP-4-amino-4,6-dideoxy-N-acetyl-beta-L-altrosamine transaminase [Rhodocytophaga aerolata]MDO1445132.1 UDP-4-amino-4,6-dideoxy-N-acetyl-beta-L-altrosamine transaminase [Rhodocytophaga aerolata]
MKNSKPIPYGRQHITQEDIEAVTSVLQSDILTQGPYIEEFEKKFANYIGSTYAVAVANGTAALHLCALALGVNSSTKVITTSITFAASANCIHYCGGSIDFVDIDEQLYLLDFDKVEKQIQSKPAGFYNGIVAVDFAGQAIDLEKLRKLANTHKLWIIEDACHAPGGYFTDSRNIKQNCGNGTYAELAIFSFHPVKHIATGEGGMITTNDKSLYDKLILLRTHGITRKPELLIENHGGWYYEMQELGYNYRITDFQAALGISQLKRATEGLQKRKSIARKYNAAFAQIESIVTPSFEDGHAYHLYVIQVPDRLDLYNYLRSKNIFAQVHYIPVHLMPYYKQLGWKKGDLPLAEAYYEHCLSLPMYPTLSEEELNYVIECIIQYYSK